MEFLKKIKNKNKHKSKIFYYSKTLNLLINLKKKPGG